MSHEQACSSTDPTPGFRYQDPTNLEQEAFRKQNREQKILAVSTKAQANAK
jgi:hypothetical protein